MRISTTNIGQDISKAKTLLKLKEAMGFEKLVVFGDSLNDVSMFRIADVTRDGELLKKASSAALTLCEADPGLRAPENGTLKRAITSYMEENNRNLIL